MELPVQRKNHMARGVAISSPVTLIMRGKEGRSSPQTRGWKSYCFPEVEFQSGFGRREVLAYHRRNSYTLEQCVTFKIIFYEKHKAGEVLFQEGVVRISDLSIPKQGDKGKGQEMMALHDDMEIEEDEHQTPVGEPNLDRMTQQASNLFKFKNFMTK